MSTKLINGVRVKLTEEEIKAKKADEAQLRKKAKATAWFRNRQKAYPSIEDQLDIIYHKGLDAWKAQIKNVKDAFPKPEEK